MRMGTKATGLERKRGIVEALVESMDRYPVIGVLDITGTPAAQFQRVRQKLRERGEIAVVKNTLIELSLQKAAEKNPKLRELSASLGGQSALVFTDMSPFKLKKLLNESMVKAPAKPGSLSSTELVIPAGETDFPPGPIVSELQGVGIKARIQAGRVVVLEDCQLVRAGEIISKGVADVLAKLGITPVELGIRLRSAFEAGLVFSGQVLEIDEKRVSGQLGQAYTVALNLALNIDYPTVVTVSIRLWEANAAAQNLALNLCLPLPEIVPILLSNANSKMLALAGILLTKDERTVDEDLKSRLSPMQTPGKPEVKAEEKPKEGEKGEEMEGLKKLFG